MCSSDLTVAALLDQQEADLETDAVDYRAELFQAQGMVMVQIGGTISEAMARMRAHAFAEGRGLSEIARDVVARRLKFDRDRP